MTTGLSFIAILAGAGLLLIIVLVVVGVVVASSGDRSRKDE